MNLDMDSVPYTIKEAVDAFIESMTDEEREAFSSIEERGLALFHLTIGSELRNAWSLWEKNTPLVLDFNRVGIQHPDDMSGILLSSAWRKLHKKPVGLKSQVRIYKNFWKKKLREK